MDTKEIPQLFLKNPIFFMLIALYSFNLFLMNNTRNTILFISCIVFNIALVFFTVSFFDEFKKDKKKDNKQSKIKEKKENVEKIPSL
jgi:uncharacterized membrane protein